MGYVRHELDIRSASKSYSRVNIQRAYWYCSRSLRKAEDFAKKFSIPKCYGDYQQLLNDKHIDVIYIGLPNHLHKKWIIRCANSGKPILCEKPLVLSTQEAHEVYSVINKAKVFCMEALMYRCHPFIKKSIYNLYIMNKRNDFYNTS